MSTGRSYGGESVEDRLARRRRQLLDAGLEIFGTTGYRQATVRQLCREARVTDRYFYEQFAGTEDLLIAVYEECLERLEAAVLAAVGSSGPGVRSMARAGLDAFLAVVQGDPRLVRLVWFEVLGVSARVEAIYLGRMRTFGNLLVSLLDEQIAYAEIDDVMLRTLSDAAVGGISHAVMSWAVSDFAAPREQVSEALTLFLDGASAPFLRH